jgi:hypothetical protein
MVFGLRAAVTRPRPTALDNTLGRGSDLTMGACEPDEFRRGSTDGPHALAHPGRSGIITPYAARERELSNTLGTMASPREDPLTRGWAWSMSLIGTPRGGNPAALSGREGVKCALASSPRPSPTSRC